MFKANRAFPTQAKAAPSVATWQRGTSAVGCPDLQLRPAEEVGPAALLIQLETIMMIMKRLRCLAPVHNY